MTVVEIVARVVMIRHDINTLLLLYIGKKRIIDTSRPSLENNITIPIEEINPVEMPISFIEYKRAATIQKINPNAELDKLLKRLKKEFLYNGSFRDSSTILFKVCPIDVCIYSPYCNRNISNQHNKYNLN